LSTVAQQARHRHSPLPTARPARARLGTHHVKPQNDLLSATGTTIFTVMSALAVEHGAINLGQGFPDYDGPADVIHAAAAALLDGRNQYPPMTGLIELREAVAAANSARGSAHSGGLRRTSFGMAPSNRTTGK